MDPLQTVKYIVQLPRNYCSSKLSYLVLLKESGYYLSPESISVEMIEQELKIQPECLMEWQGWSWDKRVSEGWYLQIDKWPYHVGWHSSKGCTNKVRYRNAVEACANFIQKEIQASIPRFEQWEAKNKKT